MNPLNAKNPTPQQQVPQQNPREAVMNRMKEMGLSVPQGMENDPNAILQHVLQSGKVPQGRQIMQRMFRR